MQKLDQVTSYILSFDEDEIDTIIAALTAYEADELADAIICAVHDCDCGGCE